MPLIPPSYLIFLITDKSSDFWAESLHHHKKSDSLSGPSLSMAIAKATLMIGFHLTVRTRHHYAIFKNFNVAQSTWIRLKYTFPEIWAACLMPNHIHLLVKTKNKEASPFKQKMTETLRRTSIEHRLGNNIWEPMPDPVAIPDAHHLKRQIRYVHLNPCRSSLTPDPLCWTFSTHRDLLGLRIRSWIKPHSFSAQEWHQYISSDPTTQTQGTAMPIMGRTQKIPQVGTQTILTGVHYFFADQNVTNTTYKTTLLHLLLDQGYQENRILMELLQVQRSRLHDLKSTPPPTWLNLARSYIYDPRLQADKSSDFCRESPHHRKKSDKTSGARS